MTQPWLATIHMEDFQERRTIQRIHVPSSATITTVNTYAAALAAVTQCAILGTTLSQQSNAYTHAVAGSPDPYGTAGFKAQLNFAVTGAFGSKVIVEVPAPYAAGITGDNDTIPESEVTAGYWTTYVAALATLGYVSASGLPVGAFTDGRLRYKKFAH